MLRLDEQFGIGWDERRRRSTWKVTLVAVAFLLAEPNSIAAQEYPEMAAVITGDLIRCGDTVLVRDLDSRYSGNRDFLEKLRFRNAVHHANNLGELPADTCAGTRKLAQDLLATDGRLKEGATATAAEAKDDFHPYSIEAAAMAVWTDACGFPRLSDRLLERFSGNEIFDRFYLERQQMALDRLPRLRCGKVEKSARRLIVSVQIYDTLPERSSQARTARDRPLVHCLLPGLRVTMRMSAGDCRERQARPFDAFTRIDHDYAGDDGGQRSPN